ncbi:MAG: flippase-like domain-containing protein [Firmicutes bacterium]|nr:flippase-like domain-containing protein [Bacillota bacterium]
MNELRNHPQEDNKNNYPLWAVFSLCIAAITIIVVFIESKNMTLAELRSLLEGAKPGWLAIAFLSMFGFIFFEGEALKTLIKSMGYSATMRQGIVYGAADSYFSAITPSASGGQPAIIGFMIKYGVPLAQATAALVLNLVFYTFSMVLLASIAILTHPHIFMNFRTMGKVLILAGSIVIVGFGAAFILLLKKGDVIHLVMKKTVELLGRIHIIKNPKKWLNRIENLASEYDNARNLMAGKTSVMIKAAIFNVMQRLSFTLIPVFMDLAIKGSTGKPFAVWATQCYVSLGSGCIPIPGAMGISDYLMIDGFGGLMDKGRVFRMEMLSRGVSFYFCVLVSGLIVLMAYIGLKEKERSQASDGI